MTKDSIAEIAGLKLGDVIVRVNDTPTSNLSHSEAHEIIMECGNNFMLGVLRPDESNESETLDNEEIQNAINDQNNETNSQRTLSSNGQVETPDSQGYCDNSTTVEDVKVDEVTDEHIAEIMSGEAEVLKEHNIIG